MRVFPVTAPKLAFQIGPSLIALRLSLLPACPSRDQVCLHPSCSPRQHGPSAQSRRPPVRWNTAMRATCVALLQGSSLRFGRGRDASYLAPPAPIRTCTLMHTALTLGA